MGLEKNLPPGEQLVALFHPFLEHLAASDLSPKTIQKHVDNMWALVGEFIRDLHNDSSLRKKPVERVLSGMIEYHCCPVRSRIESAGYQDRASQMWSLGAEEPVKWHFFKKREAENL
jgi:hypothetical protein